MKNLPPAPHSHALSKKDRVQPASPITDPSVEFWLSDIALWRLFPGIEKPCFSSREARRMLWPAHRSFRFVPVAREEKGPGWGCDGCGQDGSGKERYRCEEGGISICISMMDICGLTSD